MKQQQLTFEKGMTNVPSDAICSDNALEDSTNMIYRDGEHHVIQRPELTAESMEGTLLAVHHISDTIVNYIFYSDGDLYYKNSTYPTIIDNTISSIPSVQTLGNFLIVKDSNGTHYYLWKSDDYGISTYQNIGKQLPEISIEFQIGSVFGGKRTTERTRWFVPNSQNAEGIFDSESTLYPAQGKQEAYNDLVIGLYNKNLKAIAENKCFCEPFMACAAIELYDGSYIMPTAPQLLFPAIRCNTYAIYWKELKDVQMTTACAPLYFKATFDYSTYSDLVKDVVVFLTDGAKLYDTAVDQRAGVVSSQQTQRYWDYIGNGTFKFQNIPSGGHGNTGVFFEPLQKREDSEILDDIKSNGIFYKAFSLGITRNEASWTDASKLLKKHTLGTLVTQEQLPIDYFSHCQKTGDFMKVLNNRLHLASVHRGYAPIEGKLFKYGEGGTYTVYVEIETQNGARVISESVTLNGKPGFYFFYPDPRAKKVYIKNSTGNSRIELKLEEHPCLNGAFYIKQLPLGTNDDDTAFSGNLSVGTNDTWEHLFNQLNVSEVNNPLTFRPEGVVDVGKGKILSIASQTAALSQGQFGQYPLMTFTTEGIWALSMNNTGLYTSSHPMSREVMLEDSTPLETDGAVFFLSKKGLMVILGSQVKCVSQQLSGKNADFDFQALFGSCFMAYDYRDSLIWIIPKTSPVNFGYSALIYSINNGTFGRYLFGTGNVPTVAVNDYPDTLLQAGTNIYSLMERQDINHDGTTSGQTFTPNRYNATLRTRPMKLENGLALKTIIQIMHIKNIDGSLSFSMEGSNDLVHWCPLTSVRSIPWKYYRFEYSFSNLKAVDTFSGTVLITEERRTNKLR